MTSGTGENTKGGRRGRLRLRRRARCAPESVNNTNVDNSNCVVYGPEELPVQILSYGSSSSSDRSPENDITAMLKENLFRDSLDVKVPNEEVVCSHGCVSVIGRRREMEDAARAEVGFATGALLGDRYDFFGVYDGHGGVQVAAACKDRLHRMVKRRVEEAEGLVEWEEVMAGSFGEMDKEVLKTGGEEEKTVGSTAVVAVVGREVVVVANCGDSRAVIYRHGEAFALSNDHKPNRPDELKRIEDAGGRVINWNGHRILGVLATSRSIGDQYLKPFVIPEPEVTVMERTNADEFLILASDGLWDVISNEFACKVVKRCLEGRIRRRHDPGTEKKDKATGAAALLVELAMSRGSRDNISVIVIELNKQARTFS